jgi:hypothetical protein
MIENILLLAYLPLAAALFATKVYGWGAVTLLAFSLLYNDMHHSVQVPESLKRKLTVKKNPIPMEAVIAMAYVPLAVSLISHNLGLGIKM